MLAVDLLAAFALTQVAAPQQPAPLDLAALLGSDERLAAVLADARGHRLQVVVGEPVIASDGRVSLRQVAIGDPRQYFYPASTIKLGGAVAALVELQRIAGAGPAARPFDLDASWTIHRCFEGDATLDEVAIPIRTDLRRLFVISDNAAFNHCYELVGPQRLNAILWDAGCRSARIWHRLSEPHPLRDNRRARPVTLRGGGEMLAIAARDDGDPPPGFDNGAFRELDVGSAHLRDGSVVAAPMSFAQKNAIALADLQCLLAAVVRPDIDTGRRGFPELGVAARAFAIECLGMLPRESPDPVWPVATHPDALCKFALPGARRVVPAPHLRVYGKTGQAYGFTIENAYLEDGRTGRGVFLAAVVHADADGVVGDDVYGYADVAEPFLADLAEVVARAVFGAR